MTYNTTSIWSHFVAFHYCVLSDDIHNQHFEINFYLTSHMYMFFPNMDFQMRYKVAFKNKSLITMISFKWLLSIVYSLTTCKFTFENKFFITIIIIKWLLPIMCSLMTYKIIFVRKTFASLVTDMGPHGLFSAFFLNVTWTWPRPYMFMCLLKLQIELDDAPYWWITIMSSLLTN